MFWMNNVVSYTINFFLIKTLFEPQNEFVLLASCLRTINVIHLFPRV
jgi:hypothetical protein